jgi:rubrerythrin
MKQYVPVIRLDELMSALPGEGDAQMLRAAIVAELDAVNLYQQMAGRAKSKKVRMLLLDLAEEEQVHVGELQALLDSVSDTDAAMVGKGRAEAVDKFKVKNK